MTQMLHNNANKYSGEVSIKLGEKNIVLRPSFGALVQIEENTGKSLMELLSLILSSQITTKDLAVIIEATAKEKVDFDNILLANGLIELHHPIGKLIIQSIRGKDIKEEDTEEEKNQGK
jgi:hypothetical protein